MTKWIRLQDQLPPKTELVLGFDVFHGGFFLCRYDGDTTDEGTPWLNPMRTRGDYYEPLGEDDCHIKFWMPLPHPPNVEERG